MIRTSPSACLVAIFRDEGPYVLEWVAHHRALGFDRILVFTNGCTDGTDRLLDRLMERGEVIHAPNPKSAFGQLGVWQVAALRYATHFGAFRDSDFVMTVDADEFVDITAGQGRLADLLAAAPPFDLMSLSVVPFGCDTDAIGDGHAHGRAARPRVGLDDLAAGRGPATAVKTLMRPGLPRQFRNHRPKIDGFSAMPFVWVDGSGRPMPPDFTDRKVNLWPATGALDLAHVDHHSLRSRESFLLKCQRGDAVTDSRLGLVTEAQVDNAFAYWEARNASAGAPHRPNLPPGAEEGRAAYLADPDLRALHDAALESHRRALGAILATPAGARLAGRIGYRPA
jgi:hypothetical protein